MHRIKEKRFYLWQFQIGILQIRQDETGGRAQDGGRAGTGMVVGT